MQLIVKKITSDQVSILTDMFSTEDQLIDCEKVRRQLASGIIDIFILYKGQEPIGELRVQYDSGNNVETIDWIRVYLFAFRIVSGYRNRGCGSYLIKHVIEECCRRGYKEFTIGVDSSNNRAKHMYKKLGFDTVLAQKADSYGGQLGNYELLLMVQQHTEKK